MSTRDRFYFHNCADWTPLRILPIYIVILPQSLILFSRQATMYCIVTYDTNRCQRLWPASKGDDLWPKLMKECIKILTSRKYSSSAIQEIIVFVLFENDLTFTSFPISFFPRPVFVVPLYFKTFWIGNYYKLYIFLYISKL
jgi:hypothetical protein